MNKINVIKDYLRQLNIDEDNPGPLDALKINAFINCCGIAIDNNSNDNIVKYMEEWRTGHVGVSIKFGKEFGLDLRVVAFPETIDSINKEYVYLSHDGKWRLTLNDKKLMDAEVIPPPDWYNEEIRDGIKKTSVFQYELGNLMGTIPTINNKQNCIYFSQEMEPCKFCSLERKEKPLLPQDYAVVASNAYLNNTNTTVTLTGGNTLEDDRGVKLYIPYVHAIKNQLPDIPIEIEVSPPKNLSLLDNLVEAGLTSYNSNFEIFNESNRKMICPSKANQIPREDYLRAYEYAKDLGLDTYGALIVGLDSDNSLLNGVEFLSQHNVMTNLLPFRPLKGAIFEDRDPINPLSYLKISWEALKIMREYQVNSQKRDKGGCGLCGGCSMEVNLDRNYLKIEDYMIELDN